MERPGERNTKNVGHICHSTPFRLATAMCDHLLAMILRMCMEHLIGENGECCCFICLMTANQPFNLYNTEREIL